MLLWGEWDAPGICDLTLLQVLHQLGQPALGGGVILQDLGEGGVFELVREALPQSLSGSEHRPSTSFVCKLSFHIVMSLLCMCVIMSVNSGFNNHPVPKQTILTVSLPG